MTSAYSFVMSMNPPLVGKVLDMSQTCCKVGQMSEIFDSDVEVFDME